jgi:hypothetical protein
MVSAAVTVVALVSGRLPPTCQPLDWRNAAFNEKFGDGCYVSVGQIYVRMAAYPSRLSLLISSWLSKKLEAK